MRVYYKLKGGIKCVVEIDDAIDPVRVLERAHERIHGSAVDPEKDSQSEQWYNEVMRERAKRDAKRD